LQDESPYLASRKSLMISFDFPSLRQLRGFEAVARLKSVSRAAREVNLSQTELTQSVRALETLLAVS
jgi:hypothetical protein